MKNVILLFALVFSISTNAQSLSDLFNRKKNEILQKAQNKIENKIDNKIDQTMNKGLNGIDNAVSGKKSEKTPSAKNGAPVVSAKTYTEKLKPFGAGAYSVKESFPKIKTVTLDSKVGAVKAPKSKLFGK